MGIATLYITWAVVAVRCKIVNCSLKSVKGNQYMLLKGQFYEIMHVVAVRLMVQRFIAKSAISEKPVYNRTPLQESRF
jgi:hypothetical protein